jgi:sugar phosphate isomerase/epimerase
MSGLEIGLDFLTVVEYPAPEQIEAAARYNIRKVNLLVQPFTMLPYYNLIGDTASRRKTRERCLALDVEVEMVEPSIADAGIDPEDYRPAFETAAYLGAVWINLLPRDKDFARMADFYARTAELAGSYGLRVFTEFHRRASLRTLSETVDFIDAHGLTGKVMAEVDALHFFRLGGKVEEIVRHRDRIARVQICDGLANMPEAEQATEAREYRPPPGEGDFPLQDFINVLPDGIVVGLEVPHRTYWPEERLARSVEGVRTLLANRTPL